MEEYNMEKAKELLSEYPELSVEGLGDAEITEETKHAIFDYLMEEKIIPEIEEKEKYLLFLDSKKDLIFQFLSDNPKHVIAWLIEGEAKEKVKQLVISL